jgi:hypothetical protein
MEGWAVAGDDHPSRLGAAEPPGGGSKAAVRAYVQGTLDSDRLVGRCCKCVSSRELQPAAAEQLLGSAVLAGLSLPVKSLSLPVKISCVSASYM